MRKYAMFGVGSPVWPGVGKLVEEAGEALEVAGKLVSNGGHRTHYDGRDLRQKLIEELADLAAAIDYLAAANHLGPELDQRRRLKLQQFWAWHREGEP